MSILFVAAALIVSAAAVVLGLILETLGGTSIDLTAIVGAVVMVGGAGAVAVLAIRDGAPAEGERSDGGS